MAEVRWKLIVLIQHLPHRKAALARGRLLRS
jgi:hypothetical protein